MYYCTVYSPFKPRADVGTGTGTSTTGMENFGTFLGLVPYGFVLACSLDYTFWVIEGMCFTICKASEGATEL